MNLRQQDKKYLARDERSKNIEIVNANQFHLIDSKGKKYIDFTMGWCVGNVGWANKEINHRIKRYKGPTYVSPSFLYRPWIELAEILAAISPGKLTKSFRVTGGTEAVEIALRTANAYTKKPKFISIEGSYHGNSIGAMSIGTSSFRKDNPGLLFHSYKIKPPLDDSASDQVEKFLQRGDVAALIMEPIICNLAVLIPQVNFMKRIKQLCKKYNALLIMDEVATGFGRTGKFFASEHFDIKPDIMCLGKAITGGYAGLGAVMTTSQVAKAMEYELSSYSTYGWHPLSVEAALANIKFLMTHEKKILKNTMEMSDYFYRRLSMIKFKCGTVIRRKGLAIGLEFEKSGYSKQIVNRATEKGLLLALHSQHEITIFPALNISKSIAKKGLDILQLCSE